MNRGLESSSFDRASETTANEGEQTSSVIEDVRMLRSDP